MAEPKQGESFTMDIVLFGQGDPSSVLSAPTLAAGDFKVSVDGGALSNMDNLPAVTPSASGIVRLIFSAIEMSGDNLSMKAVDVSGDEWQDVYVGINVPVNVVDDVFDILEGDHIESSTSLVINKKDTTTALISKTVAGSLLRSDITITTVEN